MNDFVEEYEFKMKLKTDMTNESIKLKFNIGEGNLGDVVNEFVTFLRRCGYAEGSIKKYFIGFEEY